MSMIKGKNTKPEIIVRKYLFHCGFRFRVNVKRLPGTPDIVLRKYKTAIFVNGCFWHGHEGCPEFRPPRTRVEWWTEKLNRNKARDARVREELRAMGWNTMVIWECQLKPKEQASYFRKCRPFIGKDVFGIYLSCEVYPSLPAIGGGRTSQSGGRRDIL